MFGVSLSCFFFAGDSKEFVEHYRILCYSQIIFLIVEVEVALAEVIYLNSISCYYSVVVWDARTICR